MADRQITITRNGNNLSVSTNSFHVDPNNNDTLCWTCADDFAILFKINRSPFSNGKKVHSAHGGDSTVKLKIRHLTSGERGFPVNDPVNGATFEYGVAVMHPVSGQVLPLDPDVVIDDPGGGGGPKSKKKARKKR